MSRGKVESSQASMKFQIALGDIDRDHRPKDVKTVITEMEEKHGKIEALKPTFSVNNLHV